MGTLTYEDAVKELYYSLYGSKPTNYHAILFLLIQKADSMNKALLRLAYPMEVLVFDDWQQSGNENEFFAQHGIQVPCV